MCLGLPIIAHNVQLTYTTHRQKDRPSVGILDGQIVKQHELKA